MSDSASRGNRQVHRQYNQINDRMLEDSHLTQAVGGPGIEPRYVAGEDFPLETIHVKSTTEVV